MALKQIQIDNLDKVPPSAPHDSAPWVQPNARMPWQALGVICAFVLILILLAAWLLRDWFRFGAGAAWAWWALFVVLCYAIAMAVRSVLLIEVRGYTMPIWDAKHALKTLVQADIAYASREFANAAQVTYSPSAPQLSAPEYIEADTPIEEGVVLIPDSEWIGWMTEMPHTMIAGGTGTGKTTFARVELHERLSQGYAGIILDPKGKDWYNLPVHGGGRDFDAILSVLDQLHAEMASRFRAYADGERAFQPIKAIVDEVPDIMDACLDMRRKLTDGRWSRFSRQLGSLAREIGISVTLMTQSPLVEDIGMNSAMRKNFTRIALGDEAPILLREERDGKRRAQLQDLLRGQQYPAAMLRRGQVHLLDTSNVLRLSQRHIARPLHWSVNVAQLPARPVVSASVQTDRQPTVDRASVAVPGVTAPQTDRQTPKLTSERKKALIAAMRRHGRTRKEARGILAQLGEGLDNDDWAEVG